ncbi:hypothetical protein E2562_039368 [Oryza meyeriana var. granulata]|uniref:DUF834 domain-containing protein n=1 Tax=Oryza meyeriana var. granulata TaxID=110450 RepID=A0A6G1E9W8_9ORYZ|nr:hypothetical protein E2562_039368 [Oryza meyeriana var. granulata]
MGHLALLLLEVGSSDWVGLHGCHQADDEIASLNLTEELGDAEAAELVHPPVRSGGVRALRRLILLSRRRRRASGGAGGTRGDSSWA